MSEVKNDAATNEREKYTVDIEPLDFNEVFSGTFITSSEFAKLTSDYFKIAFGDCRGCKFEFNPNNNNEPTISLFFNHNRDVEGTRACERVSDKKVGNTIIDKTRGRDLQMKEGDRYHITPEGEDIIKPLLYPRFYNQGKPQWKRIVTDVKEATGGVFQSYENLTKITGINPAAICKILWGGVEVDGNAKDSSIDYEINIRSNLTNGMINAPSNYVLEIKKVSYANVIKTYENLGIGFMGSSIIG